MLWPGWRIWTVDGDRGIPPDRRTALGRATGVPGRAVHAASLEPIAARVAKRRPGNDGAWPWITAIRWRDRRVSLPQFCPQCLAADGTAHYRIDWRLAWHTGCPKHRCALAERCTACGNPQRLHRLGVDAKHIGVCAACGTDLGGAETPACREDALRFQEAADGVSMTGAGRCLGEEVEATEWFAAADFLAAVLRRAARSPSKALSGITAAAGIQGPIRLPAASGARIERLGRAHRETLLGAVHRLVSMRRSDLEDAIEETGASRQTLFGDARRVPRPLAALEPALPDRGRRGGRRAPRPRRAGPRPRHEIRTMMNRLEGRLEGVGE